MSTKGISNVINMVKTVGRQVTKAVPVIIPAGTIVANVIDVATTSPDAVSALMEFVKRYTAVDMKAGKLDGAAFLKGGGTLIITGIIGKLLHDLV